MIDFGSLLDKLEREGNLRTIPTVASTGVIDFSTNDYLGLSEIPQLERAFLESQLGEGAAMSASASRLLASRQQEFGALEERLSELYGGRGVLTFNSGYHANTGIIPAIAKAGKITILADKLVHASIIDGIMLSKAPFSRFRHNNLEALRRDAVKLLSADDITTLLIVVESVYSMDGDSCDINALLDLRKELNALYSGRVMVYVDEAHAFGVCGPAGLGLCAATGRMEEVDIMVGTFGKALCSAGAFVCARKEIIDWLKNSARSFIFSTALPPIQALWTLEMVNRMIGMDSQRQHLRKLASLFSPEAGHIVPVMVGDSHKVVELSHKLEELGYKVLPIRTPTVPPSTERLRISLSAARSVEEVENLIAALKQLNAL